MNNEALFYYNGTGYTKITDILNDNWYQFRVDFDGTNQNYAGLGQY